MANIEEILLKELHHDLIITLGKYYPYAVLDIRWLFDKTGSIDAVIFIMEMAMTENISLSEVSDQLAHDD